MRSRQPFSDMPKLNLLKRPYLLLSLLLVMIGLGFLGFHLARDVAYYFTCPEGPFPGGPSHWLVDCSTNTPV